MKILVVDTSSNDIRVAVGDGRSAIASSIQAPGAHDEKIFRQIEKLLKKARLRLSDIEGLAVASGPGSFTGIRVGLTLVSVLAQALDIPAAVVSLLEAEAARSLRSGVPIPGVVFPSSKDEFFFQIFTAKSAGEPKWIPSGEWPAAFKKEARGKKGLVLVGPGAEQAARALGDRKPPWRKPMPLSAADLIEPALRKLEAGDHELAPLYLKPAYYERKAPRLVR